MKGHDLKSAGPSLPRHWQQPRALRRPRNLQNDHGGQEIFRWRLEEAKKSQIDYNMVVTTSESAQLAVSESAAAGCLRLGVVPDSETS